MNCCYQRWYEEKGQRQLLKGQREEMCFCGAVSNYNGPVQPAAVFNQKQDCSQVAGLGQILPAFQPYV